MDRFPCFNYTSPSHTIPQGFGRTLSWVVNTGSFLPLWQSRRNQETLRIFLKVHPDSSLLGGTLSGLLWAIQDLPGGQDLRKETLLLLTLVTLLPRLGLIIQGDAWGWAFFFLTSDHSARVHVGHNIEFRLWKLRPIITTFPISFTFKGLFPIGLPTELCQNENHLLQPQEMTTPLILSLARLPILTHCSTSSCPYITSLVSLIINLWEAPQKILQTTSLLGVTKQS